MRLRSPFLALVVLTLALSGCSAGSDPTASPSSSPSSIDPTPSPTATPEEPEPAAMLLTGAGFTLVDDAGAVLFEHSWSGPITDATQELTDVFGEPTTDLTPQGPVRGEYVEMRWDGMQFTALAAYDQPLEGDRVWSRVQVEVQTIAGIAIRTTSGASVGMTADEVVALGAQAAPEVEYAMDPDNPALFDSTDEPAMVVSVRVGSDGLVFELLAPVGTFGNM